MDFFVENENKSDSIDLKEYKTEIKPNKALCEPTILRSNKLDLAVQELKDAVGAGVYKSWALGSIEEEKHGLGNRRTSRGR